MNMRYDLGLHGKIGSFSFISLSRLSQSQGNTLSRKCVLLRGTICGCCQSNGVCYAVRVVSPANSFGSFPDLREVCPLFRGKRRRRSTSTRDAHCSDRATIATCQPTKGGRCSWYFSFVRQLGGRCIFGIAILLGSTTIRQIGKWRT